MPQSWASHIHGEIEVSSMHQRQNALCAHSEVCETISSENFVIEIYSSLLHSHHCEVPVRQSQVEMTQIFASGTPHPSLEKMQKDDENSQSRREGRNLWSFEISLLHLPHQLNWCWDLLEKYHEKEERKVFQFSLFQNWESRRLSSISGRKLGVDLLKEVNLNIPRSFSCIHAGCFWLCARYLELKLNCNAMMSLIHWAKSWSFFSDFNFGWKISKNIVRLQKCFIYYENLTVNRKFW